MPFGIGRGQSAAAQTAQSNAWDVDKIIGGQAGILAIPVRNNYDFSMAFSDARVSITNRSINSIKISGHMHIAPAFLDLNPANYAATTSVEHYVDSASCPSGQSTDVMGQNRDDYKSRYFHYEFMITPTDEEYFENIEGAGRIDDDFPNNNPASYFAGAWYGKYTSMPYAGPDVLGWVGRYRHIQMKWISSNSESYEV